MGAVSIFAGNSCRHSFGGEGISALGACMYATGITSDTAGNIYISDPDNVRIRKVNTSGIIVTVAGDGTVGYSGDGGPGPVAEIGLVHDIASDRAGNCYIVDIDNYRIRRVDHSTGIIVTVAGNGTPGFSGDGGPASSATFSGCSAIYVDQTGDLLLQDNNRIRKITTSTGIITTIAGGSSAGFSGDGGPATAALLNNPSSIASDNSGNVYFVDQGNYRVRKIDPSGIITTVAGGSTLKVDGCQATNVALTPIYVGTDSLGNIYVENIDPFATRYQWKYKIMKIDPATNIINIVVGLQYTGVDIAIYGNEDYSDGHMHITPSGDIYGSFGAVVSRITDAGSGISTWSARDSIASPACSLPGTISYSLDGIITDTSISATDSLDVMINTGDAYMTDAGGFWHSIAEPIVHTRLPYNATSGIYHFGSLYSNVGSYNYKVPGIYHRSLKITTHDGYSDYFPLSTDTIRANCDTTITGVTGLSLWDSIITLPCVSPAMVRYVVSGSVTGTPSAADSMYIIMKYDDSAMSIYKVPYTLSGSVYTYSLTCYRSYIGTLRAYATVDAVTSNGLYSQEDYFRSNLITTCGHGRYDYSMFDTSSFATGCSLPFHDRFSIFGAAYDSATIDTSFAARVIFGDGTDTIINIPIVNNGHGEFSIGGTFTHSYGLPGAYTPYVVDSSGVFSIIPSSVIFGTGGATELTLGSSCSPVYGRLYIDADSNCLNDTGEIGLAYWPYRLINNTLGTISYGWCDDTGGYSITALPGYSYTLMVDSFTTSAGRTITATCPSSGSFSFVDTGGTYYRDFAFYSVPDTSGTGGGGTATRPTDMSISGWTWGLIPGDTGILGIWASDDWGYTTDSLSATVTYVLDSNLSYIGMWRGPSPSSISGDTLRWNFTTSASLFEFNAMVKVRTDTAATIFDTIRNYLHVTPSRYPDPDLSNNIYTWRQPVVGSWDPNEKIVSPTGYGAQGYIVNGTQLSYMIHFQNTGTARARNITVADTISTNLDLSTLQIVGSNSRMLVYNTGDNVIKFRFNDINLPDSASDPEGSIGYVSFTVSPHDSLAAGTTITNKVGIYFDYNPAVYTNTTINTIEDTVGVIHGADSVCAGASITLTNHIAGGVWTASNGHASVSGGIVTGTSPGIDTITYTVYGYQHASKIIHVISAPGTGIITGSHTVCISGTDTLAASVPGGSWATLGTGIITVSAGGVVGGIATGTDTVYYSVTNPCGTARLAFAISVSGTMPSAGTITGASAVCEGATTSLSASVTGGSWSTSSGIASVSTGGIVTGISSGSDTVYYTVTNSCGSARALSVITINPAPVAGTITGAGSVCVGASTALTPSVTGGVWSASGTAVATVSGGVVTALSTGIDTVFYSVTNSCGTVAASFVVTVITTPSAGSLAGTTAVCTGASITLTASVSGGSWSSSATGIASVSGGVVSGLAPGIDTIFYTVTNTCGIASTYALVSVTTLPVAGTLSGTSSVCVSAATTLTPSVSGGVWSSSNSAIAPVAGGIVTGVTAGAVTITYAVTNSCGSADTTFAITVTPLPDAGSITGADSICIADTATLYNTAGSGLWSTSNAAVASVSSTGVASGVTGGSATISFTATNSCGSASSTHTIFVRALVDCPDDVIALHNLGKTLSLYPNPNNGQFVIGLSAHESDVVISVIDMHGRTIKTINITDNKLTEIPVDLNRFAAGIYMLKVQVGNTVYNRKVVVM